MTRGDFAIGACLDASVADHFKVSMNRIVIFFPELFWSKYEPKQIVFEKVGYILPSLYCVSWSYGTSCSQNYLI